MAEETSVEAGTPVTVSYHQLFRFTLNEVCAASVPPLSVGSRGGRGSPDKISMNISQRTSLPAANIILRSREARVYHDRRVFHLLPSPPFL